MSSRVARGCLKVSRVSSILLFEFFEHVPSALNPADALSKGFDDPERWSAFVKVLLGHVPPFGVQQAAKAA